MKITAIYIIGVAATFTVLIYLKYPVMACFVYSLLWPPILAFLLFLAAYAAVI
jgi:hypothetical protein